MPVVVFVRFGGRDIKYEIDSERSLDVHIANLCTQFNLQPPDLYGLQIGSTYSFLKPEVCVFTISK